MNTRQQRDELFDAAQPGTVDCFQCGQPHEATPSHINEYSQDVIWAVVCPVDDLTDYYTREVVNVVEVDDPVPYLLTADGLGIELRDESGSASGRLVALVCWSLTWTMLAFLLLVWFAPPGQAVRIVPGSPAASRDWCPNIEGTQSVQSYLWHYRIKVHKGHGPKAGEVRCLPRKSRGHK